MTQSPDNPDVHARDIVALYERHGPLWDRTRGRSLFEKPWLDRMLAHVPPRGSVLDLGCGGGEPLAAYFLEQGRRVTGVDTSQALLALCRKRFPGGEWIRADMRGLNLGRAFDAVVAWDSFFHLTRDEQRAMFPAFARHAKPGAALLFTSGPGDGTALGELGGDPLHHASLDPGEYRALLRANGFFVVDHAVEDPACGGHTIWLARRADPGDPGATAGR